MSHLVVGLNHRTAPVEVLERAVRAVGDDAAAVLVRSDHVSESVVLATCNRVELYAEVSKFHAGVADLTAFLVERGGVPVEQLDRYLYVHYQDRVVQHLFSVAAGLDSMVIGEQQVLGQVRAALRTAEEYGTVGRALGELFRYALRTGKRARAETRIDAAGASLVGVALDTVTGLAGDLSERRVLVVGAGAMSALTVATLHRRGVADVAIANRTRDRAARLAKEYGGTAVDLADLPVELRAADVVVTCTGAVGTVLSRAAVAAAMAARTGRPLVLVDLALPRDVEPAAGAVPGVTLVGLDRLAGQVDEPADVDAARRVVGDQVVAYGTLLDQAQVAPTVAALRSAAARVVHDEMDRLRGRVPDLDDRAQAEVARTVHRIVEKLLHTPTVRVKELASGPDGSTYAAALRELFDLDPATVDAVASLTSENLGAIAPRSSDATVRGGGQE